MGQHAFSGIAMLVALTFLVMALASCASTAQVASSAIAPIPPEAAATPEFHGAHIARDALRDRLPSEN